jgi:hypothetical protein
MRPTDDQPTDAHPTDQTTDRRLTVAQAAVLLGLSEDAVRSRLKRGTLSKEKDADGTVFVVLEANGRPIRPTTNGDRPTTGQTTDQSALALMQAHLDSLGEQLTYIRDQLDQEREANRENRRIIAGLVQRVPELGPAYEPRHGPETDAEKPERVDPHPAAEEAQEATGRRSWLYRFFFGSG